MNERERAFLRAASNLVEFQEPVLAHFESAAGMSAFDYWIRKRVGRRAGSQSPKHDPWHYFFHGLEVDATHRDGRHLRIELGPHGMTNVFTGYSVAVHIVRSKPPWPSYASSLKESLCGRVGLPDYYLALDLEQALLAYGMFARSDPRLFALREQSTIRSPDGSLRIVLPPGIEPATLEDVMLCERLVFTEDGQREAKAV